MTKTIIHSLEEMPEFATEQEERAWWDSVELGPELLDKFRPVREVESPELSEPRAETVPIRFDADEYEGLAETAHVLRSPQNATRLLTALQRALAGEGEPETLAEFRQDLSSARDA